jgi:hypothetical protein
MHEREGHPELEAPATHAGYAQFRQNGINSQLMLKYHLLPMLTCCLQQKCSRDFLVGRVQRARNALFSSAYETTDHQKMTGVSKRPVFTDR